MIDEPHVSRRGGSELHGADGASQNDDATAGIATVAPGGPTVPRAVSYTHLTLPTILRV